MTRSRRLETGPTSAWSLTLAVLLSGSTRKSVLSCAPPDTRQTASRFLCLHWRSANGLAPALSFISKHREKTMRLRVVILEAPQQGQHSSQLRLARAFARTR